MDVEHAHAVNYGNNRYRCRGADDEQRNVDGNYPGCDWMFISSSVDFSADERQREALLRKSARGNRSGSVNRPLPGRLGLFLAEDDSTFGQVVGGKFHFDAVTGKNSDEMLSHFAGDNAQDFLVGPVQFQFEHGIGQGESDDSFKFDRLGFGHGYLVKSEYR